MDAPARAVARRQSASSADKRELIQRLRSGLVQVFEHPLSGDAIEVPGAAGDVEPRVVAPNVAPVLDVARATDLTVEVHDPSAPQHPARPNLAPTAVTADPVVVIQW